MRTGGQANGKAQQTYRRLHQVWLDMAEQSKSPDARARWLALARLPSARVASGRC